MRRLLDWLRWERRGEADLDEEIRAHLEIEADRLMREERLGPADARAAARRRFGNALRTREESRAVWTVGALDSWLQDARFGLRLLARSPAFAVIAVASLAIGLGTAVAAFSLLDTVLLRTLPVTAPHDLVLLRWVSGQDKDLLANAINGWLDLDENGRRTSTSFSYAAYTHLRDRQATLASTIAFAEVERLVVRTGRDTVSEITGGQFVSGNYFAGLGVRTVAGRPIQPDDDRRDADAVAVISYTGWQRRFGGDPSVIGARVSLNRVPFVIVGVTPAGFNGCLQVGVEPEFTIPLSLQPRLTPADGQGLDDAGYWWLQVMGRLKPDVGRERAAAEMAVLFDQHVATLPKPEGGVEIPSLVVSSGAQGLVEKRRELASPLTLVAALVGLVLLVAAANVAGLLLARATARTREMALRMALGAGRRRLVRQMLVESVTLSLLGGLAGVVLATWFVPLLLSAAQPRVDDAIDLPFRADGTVILFALALSVGLGVVLGLLATLRSTGGDVAAGVRERSGTAGGGRRTLRLGKALVIAQIGLAFLLVVTAGLFTGSLANLQRVQTGMNASGVLLFQVQPGLQGYEGPRLSQLYTALLERVAAIPGVKSVGVSRNALFTGSAAITTVVVPGRARPAGAGRPDLAWMHVIAGRYLETLEIPLLAGRRLGDGDGPDAPRVALVNRTFARNYFDSDAPVGRTFQTERDGAPIEIVGIVADALYTEVRSEVPPTVYRPVGQMTSMMRAATICLRTELQPASVVAGVRRVVRAIDPELPVLEVTTQEEQIERSMSRERRVALTAGVFGLLTVVLACIGLYGVMAYAVSRRTGEIGVRLALGASPGRLVREILRETAAVIGLGLAIGVPVGLLAARLVRTELFGIEPTDPFTLAAAAALVALVGLAAGFAPARRASRVDPLAALRAE